MDSILYWLIYPWAWGLPYRMVDTCSIAPLKIFPSQVSLVNTFLLNFGTLCLLPLFHAGILSSLNFCCLMYDVTVAEFICASGRLCQKMLFPWNHLLAVALRIFPPPLPRRSLSLWGERYDTNITFGTEHPMSFTLYIVQLWVSMLITICKKQLLW